MNRIVFILRTSFGMVPSALRGRLFWLFPLMAAAALLEMIGLALVVPLINALAGAETSPSIPTLGRLTAVFDNLDGASTVVSLAIVVAAFYVVKNAVLLFAVYAENAFIMQAVALTAGDLCRAYLNAPYPFHLRHNSAELIRNLNLSVDDTFRSVLKSILRMILEVLIVLGTFAVLMIANLTVTLAVGAGFAVVLGLFFILTQPLLARWGRRIQALHKSCLQTLSELLGMIKEIKVLGREAFFAGSYATLRREMSRIYVWHQTVSELPRLLIETLLIGAFVAAIVLVHAQGQQTRDVLPLLALYALAGFRLMPSFNRIAQYATNIRFSAPALDQVARHQEDVRYSHRLAPDVGRTAVRFEADLKLDGVSFRYEGSAGTAVDGISIRIEKGKSVGLVGPSGSGKTTVANLILGLLDLQQGRLLIDGLDVGSNVAGWQRIVGYVPQEIMLLDDTLRRNIALGVSDREIDEDALNDAMKSAKLNRVVEELPDGHNTVVGERGVRLSGGQRQRIGIARALYHRPQVLIMDEATSALDNETERSISNALAELHGKVTMIIIAHRLSTVRHCDMLVFMKDGRIVDTGTFDDLHARNAEFRRMVELGELTPKLAGNS